MTAPGASPDALAVLRDVFVRHHGAGGPVMALRGIDLDVRTGERLVITGPNGSGKTTLVRALVGDQPVTAGSVVVAGTDLTALSAVALRRWRAATVGFADQHAGRSLLPELSVPGNVALQLRLAGTGARAADRAARRALEDLGLAGLADRDVGTLSGGEAQRVAICAAVAHRPRLVLADEPTGELDADGAREVLALLDRIAAAGAAVVLVTHDPRSERGADRVVAVRDGRIAGITDGAGGPDPQRDSRGWLLVPPQDASADLPADPPAATATAGGAATAEAAGPPALALRGVTVRHGDRVVHDGLDLAVTPGSWVVLDGPSGSGKTTLLRLAAGMTDPDAGQVVVGGRRWPADRTARALLRREVVATAPQRTTVLDALTVRENLDQVRGARGGAGTRDVGVDEVLAALALDRLADAEAASLSGGERQRLSVARVLVSGAPLLLLDEPTAQQDPRSARLVVAAVRAAVTAGAAVLSASHDPLLVGACDAVVRLAGPRGSGSAEHPGDAGDAADADGAGPPRGSGAVAHDRVGQPPR